jgi:AraC family transcriptional regulator
VDITGNQLAGAPESASADDQAFDQYGAKGLLASSLYLGWSGLSAALRTHERGALEWNSTHPEIELCVAICSSNSVVTRLGAGIADRKIAQRGTVWLCPAVEHQIEFSTPTSQILHIYLPTRHFSAESLGVNVDQAAPASLRHQHSFEDPLVAEIAFALASEMRRQTAGGKLLAESLAVSLAARLVQSYTALSPDKDFEHLSNQGLDRRRLKRVKEYIAANLEADLTIAELAKVASLSQYHFARAFKVAVGQSPHQYVSAYRLERAKELLIQGDQSLLDIAIALNFSSQANFTRAFRKGTGKTPGQYRRGLTQR